MKNLNKFEQEEEYDNLLYYSVIPSIQEKIEESIRNGYVLTYYIAVDTDVNQGHLDYNLMDKLLTNNYLHHIEDIENYIKAFGDDKTLTVDHDGKEIIVKDPEQHAKVTFYIDDWGRWEHTMERMEN